MTDDELAEELAATMRALADSYQPSGAAPAPSEPRRSRLPFALASAAAVIAVLAGLGVVLWNGADNAADLDIRDDPTSTPVPTSTPGGADSFADPLAGWTWALGPPAPVEPRAGHELLWSGDEVGVWGGDQGPGAADGAAAAYSTATDTWRELIPVEVQAAERLRDNPDIAATVGFEPPAPSDALLGILYGRVDATPLAEGGPAPWILTGDDGGELELPDIPDRFGFGFIGARAAWTGEALVVWGGQYDCGPGANCAYFGPSEPFVLTPPERPTSPRTVDLPIGNGEPVDLSDYLGITWVLYSVEVGGELVSDDEPGTIAFEVNPTGPKPNPLPMTATGWAGCDYTAALISLGDGALTWSDAPGECPSATSSFAARFIELLAETRQTNLLELWPTEFLELTGPDIRILLVPATDNTVVGPFVPPPTATPTTTAAPPPTPEPPADTSTSLTDVVDARWILYSLEVDGSLVADDEASDITLELTVTGLPDLDSAELRIDGQAGCSYSAGVSVDSISGIAATDPGALTWHTPPGDCTGASALATTYLSRLADTTGTALLELSPTPFLELTGPSVRFLFVPVAPAPIAPIAPPAPLVPPSEPVSTSGASSTATTWPLDAPPHGDLVGWSYVVGDEIITLADDPDPNTWALVGQGYNTVSGQWRVLPSQSVLTSEVLQGTTWTGDSIAAYTQGGGYAELLEYDPLNDQWRYISGWEFFGSRYTTVLMEMRAGEIYIEGEAGGARWHIRQQEGGFGSYDRVDP